MDSDNEEEVEVKISEPLELEKQDNIRVKKQMMRVVPETIKEAIRNTHFTNFNQLLIAITSFCFYINNYLDRKSSNKTKKTNCISTTTTYNTTAQKETAPIMNEEYLNSFARTTRHKTKVNYKMESNEYDFEEEENEEEPKKDEEEESQFSEEVESESESKQWEDNCAICNKGGDVICCDTCDKVFHLRCLELKEIPEGNWSCLHCYYKAQ